LLLLAVSQAKLHASLKPSYTQKLALTSIFTSTP